MDDLLERMQIYERALVAFNERLRDSMTDLEKHHEAVAPYWDASSDNMRRHYDAQWDPLDAMMKHYLRVEGPGYVEFLNCSDPQRLDRGLNAVSYVQEGDERCEQDESLQASSRAGWCWKC